MARIGEGTKVWDGKGPWGDGDIITSTFGCSGSTPVLPCAGIGSQWEKRAIMSRRTSC